MTDYQNEGSSGSSRSRDSISDEISSSYEDVETVEPVKVYGRNYNLHQRNFVTTERQCNNVDSPITTFVDDQDFWDENSKLNVDVILEHISGQGKLTKKTDKVGP
jgi:hypothetical protein